MIFETEQQKIFMNFFTKQKIKFYFKNFYLISLFNLKKKWLDEYLAEKKCVLREVLNNIQEINWWQFLKKMDELLYRV